MVMDESRDNNIAWVLVEGGCSVYKKGGMAARENLEKWIDASQKELKDHPHFESFCKRMRRTVRAIPKDANIYIGEIAQEEAIGFESLLGEQGRSIFTIQTVSPEAKYYPITKQIRKMIWQHFTVRMKLVDYVMSVLMYRLNCLENILKILIKDKDKSDADKTGDFNKMIGSKALKNTYINESDQIFKVMTDTHMLHKPTHIQKRSKEQYYQRMVNLEEQKLKARNELEDMDLMKVNMHTHIDKSSKESKLKASFSNQRYKHFNRPEISIVEPRIHNYTGSVANLMLPEVIGSENIITNFHKLKDTLIRLQNKKILKRKAQIEASRNAEINNVIDEFSARTRSKLFHIQISL